MDSGLASLRSGPGMTDQSSESPYYPCPTLTGTARLAASLRQGVEMAIRTIDEGDAAAKVGAFVEATRRAAGR